MIVVDEITKHWAHIESMTSVLGEFKQQTQERLESLEKQFSDHQMCHPWLQTWTTPLQAQSVQQVEHENEKLKKALRAEEAQSEYWRRDSDKRRTEYEAMYDGKAAQVNRLETILAETRDQRDRAVKERNSALNTASIASWAQYHDLRTRNCSLSAEVAKLECEIAQLLKAGGAARSRNRNLADEIRSLKAEIGRA